MENAKIEMERLGIDILGVSEIKWTGADDFWSGGYRVTYSGDDRRIAGVGVMLKKEWGRRVKVILPVKDLKKNKAPGEDKIDGETIKALGKKPRTTYTE